MLLLSLIYAGTVILEIILQTIEAVNIKPIVLLTMLVDTCKSISVQILVNSNNYYLQFLCTYNVHLKRYCSIFLCFTVAF